MTVKEFKDLVAKIPSEEDNKTLILQQLTYSGPLDWSPIDFEVYKGYEDYDYDSNCFFTFVEEL